MGVQVRADFYWEPCMEKHLPAIPLQPQTLAFAVSSLLIAAEGKIVRETARTVLVLKGPVP